MQGDYSSSGCWDDNEDDLEGAVQCALEDFRNYLRTPYPKELGNIPNPATVYRFVNLKKPEDLNSQNLGISWFSDLDKPKDRNFFAMLDYLTTNRPHDEGLYLLTGQVMVDNIDIPNTLWQRSTQWQENEIVVKNPSLIKLQKIDLYEKPKMGRNI